jgi:hypothetical protein
MAKKYKLKEIEVGDVKVSDGVKSTVTDIDSTTGAISWSIAQIPNIDRLLDESDALVATAKGVYTKVKDDKVFLDIYQQAKSLRNVIRTHTRNNYPEEYKKSRGVNEAPAFQWRKANSPAGDTLKDLVPRKVGTSTVQEDDVDEATGVNGDIIDLNPSNKTKVGNYVKLPHHLAAALLDIADEIMGKESSTISSQPQIKQALALLKKAAEKAMTGDKEVEEISTSGAAGAYLTPYAFRKKGSKSDDKAYKELGYKLVKEKALPVVRKKLAKVPKAKKVASKYRMKMPSGVVSSLGYTMGEGALGDGADLGPGPKAGPDGVTNNAYTKQFKYKLVPKNKDGTYVQKGAGMIVKKLY